MELQIIQDLGMLYPNKNSKQKRRYGLYKCFCGEEFKAQMYAVNIKNTISCGCYQKTRAKKTLTTHNLRKHSLYHTWFNMIQRCTNPNNKSYKNYGGRGITVCDEWLDIKNFINDMYSTFQEGLTLDRKDNNKGYSKDNCRWQNRVIQNQNTRKLRKTNTSGYRGVSWIKTKSKWRSAICAYNKIIHLGYFDNPIDGAKAYDDYIIQNNLEHTRNFS